MQRPNLRIIDGGLSVQSDTTPSPAPSQTRSEPNVEQIADGMTLRGEFIRFSPTLRLRFASLAAENRTRKRGGAA
jgi:hypothetical protein